MSEQILEACRELTDDAKAGCADLVLKETCIEILSKARNVLSDEQIKQLVVYTTEKTKEKTTLKFQSELTIQK